MEMRASRVTVAMHMPVIVRDELLKVQTSCVGAAIHVLVIERHLFLKIEAPCICTTNGGFTDGGYRQEENEKCNGCFHG